MSVPVNHKNSMKRQHSAGCVYVEAKMMNGMRKMQVEVKRHREQQKVVRKARNL